MNMNMNMNSSDVNFVKYPSFRRGLISNEDFSIINNANACIMLLVCSVGAVANAINLKTFISMGLKDGFTVSLFGLALSDFGFTFVGCILSLSNIVQFLEDRHVIQGLPIQPKYVIGMFAAYVGFIFYPVTCMTTTFMAIARCMCVAMPFKFKDYFTRTKSIIALVAFNLIAIATYAPVISQTGTQRKYDPSVNRTRVVLWMSDKRSEIKNKTAIFHFAVLTFASSIIVAVCIVIMARSLKESVRFRNTSTTGTDTGGDVTKENKDKLSGKELQVLRQVIVISTIYTATMAPNIVVVIYRLTDADFDVRKRLHNLTFVVGTWVTILEQINSASTFLVYYTYNSKFRSLCFPCLAKSTE